MMDFVTHSDHDMRTLDGVRIVEYDRIGKAREIERIWRDLQEHCEHEYFLSWGWISTWLASLPQEVDVRLVVGYLQEQPALAFFLGFSRRRKYGILPTRTLSLNTTGSRYLDLLYIEYNGVLHIPSLQFSMDDLLEVLVGRPWDEFSLAGLTAEFARQTGLLDSETAPVSAGL